MDKQDNGSEPWRLCSDDDLVAFCRPGDVLMLEAFDRGDAQQVHATYDRIEAAMRAFCDLYAEWVVLTEQYVFETLGLDARKAMLRPERQAELAVRTGMDLDELLDAERMCAGPDSPVALEVKSAADRRDRDALVVGYRRAEAILRDAHDYRRERVADLLSHLLVEHGEAKLEEAMMWAAANGWWHHSMPTHFHLEPRDRIADYAFMLTIGGFSTMRVEEERDRFVIIKDICGNCGRQVADRYKRGDWRLAAVEGPSDLTWRRTRPVTVYQSHLAIIHHSFAIDAFGAPFPAFDCLGMDGDHGGCRQYLYKDPRDTPEEYYAMVGRTRPA